MEEHQIVLMNEDKSQSINVWFLGYTLERVQEFITKNYAENPRNTRWVQFKIVY